VARRVEKTRGPTRKLKKAPGGMVLKSGLKKEKSTAANQTKIEGGVARKTWGAHMQKGKKRGESRIWSRASDSTPWEGETIYNISGIKIYSAFGGSYVQAPRGVREDQGQMEGRGLQRGLSQGKKRSKAVKKEMPDPNYEISRERELKGGKFAHQKKHDMW